MLIAISKRGNELREEVCEAAVGNVRHERVEEEHPSERIEQCLLELIELPVLVAHALFVDTDAFNRQDSILLVQKPRIELAVWDDEEKENTDNGCE